MGVFLGVQKVCDGVQIAVSRRVKSQFRAFPETGNKSAVSVLEESKNTRVDDDLDTLASAGRIKTQEKSYP